MDTDSEPGNDREASNVELRCKHDTGKLDNTYLGRIWPYINTMSTAVISVIDHIMTSFGVKGKYM